MEKTLCQFGQVLFDELEQVAVRRGGFASLTWLRDEDASLREFRDALGKIRAGVGANPEQVIANVAPKAQEYAVRVQEAVRSVQALAEVIVAKAKAARQATRVALGVMEEAEGPAIGRLIVARVELGATSLPSPGRIRRALAWAKKLVKKPAAGPADPWGELLAAHGAYIQVLRGRLAPDINIDRPYHHLEQAWERFQKHSNIGDAEARRRYDEALKALRETVRKAVNAGVNHRISQEIHLLADRARRRATRATKTGQEARTKADGLSGGAGPILPKAAMTALAGFLASAREALDEAIGAYAELVEVRRRAGDVIREARGLETPVPSKPGPKRERRIIQYPNVLFEMDDMVTDAARRAATDLGTVGLAFSGGGIRSATFNLGVLQGLASLGLLRRFDYLSTVSGGGYIGSWLAAWLRREGGAAGDPTPGEPGSGWLELAGKRRRTANALENVQAQLCPGRRAQETVDRRWITAEELASGVEGRGRMVNRVVDEEPEPIYHLRRFSNYLTPKVGLASADTWTMVSIYLRNLMLNQFILLPLVLSLVLVPRLMLAAFGLDLSESWWHGIVECLAAVVMIGSGYLAFGTTYRVIMAIRASRGRAPDRTAVDRLHEANLGYLKWSIMLPLVLASLSFVVLFAHRTEGKALGPWYYPSSLILWPWAVGGDANPRPLESLGWMGSLLHLLRQFIEWILWGGDAIRRWFVGPEFVSRPAKPIDWITITFSGWAWITAAFFGVFVGCVRFLASLSVELWSKPWNASEAGQGVEAHRAYQRKRVTDALKRSIAPFASAFFAVAGLYLVLAMIRSAVGGHVFFAPLMATVGVPLLLLTAGVGSAIEVGLIGKYEEEDMREWRASLGGYFSMIAALWAFFFGLSLYGPLLVWATGRVFAAAIAAGWISLSALGVLVGRSPRTGEGKKRGPLDYVALVAPMVFLAGLLVAVSILACAVQGIDVPFDPNQGWAPNVYLRDVVDTSSSWWTVFGLAACAGLALYNCYQIDVNLFSLNLFYANRLVRCYLGASRPHPPANEGRPNVAPSHCPVPARRPNPLTGFDPDDDFPIKDLAIVRTWDGKDLVCDYRGPYHLINAAMNLVSGSNLAWQERMAAPFVLSPLYCGSQTTGYRKAVVVQDEVSRVEGAPDYRDDDKCPERGLVKGYGGDLRLGTAVSISGAAASPNMGYHTSPLVTILMTVFNVRLGMWLPNPAKPFWRKVGPGFANYLVHELTGQTSDEGDYVYLSDGGHFENLGVYELIRRRCRVVVACDAGADPSSSFWDLGSLVRKCREDLGVGIEIDIAPLLRADGTGKSPRHCVVGKIHYEDVDGPCEPGTLIYIKPSLTGDESSDVRNYVVEHPDFPHEPTSDQFFGESQFESYRQLGEHIASRVFGEVEPSSSPERYFQRLAKRWSSPPRIADRKVLDVIETFIEAHKALWDDRWLDRLRGQLYPKLIGVGATDEVATLAEAHAVCRLLHAVEDAWLKLDLGESPDHSMGRGWQDFFRRLAASQAFRDHWPHIRGEFSGGFVKYCENGRKP